MSPKNYNSHGACRLWWAILLSLILSLGLGACGKKKEAPRPEVVRPAKIITVGQGEGTETRKYPGKVRAMDRVELSFEVSGKLIELSVNDGQSVKQGAVIARIDPRDFQSKLDAAKASERQAASELKRYANLLKDHVVARSNYDVKKRNHEVAVSDVNIAQKALDNTTLRAPFSGRIGRKMVENFQVVQAKQPIVVLQKKGMIEIVVNVPERAVALAKVGDKGEIGVEFSSLPGKRYPVTVKEYAAEADPQTQTYRVVVTMPAPKEINVFDGMTATVYYTRHNKNVKGLTIPAAAAFADNGKTFVWRLDQDMRVQPVAVRLGLMDGDSVAIESGLASGDRIVAAGVQNLTAGQKVREYNGVMGE